MEYQGWKERIFESIKKKAKAMEPIVWIVFTSGGIRRKPIEEFAKYAQQMKNKLEFNEHYIIICDHEIHVSEKMEDKTYDLYGGGTNIKLALEEAHRLVEGKKSHIVCLTHGLDGGFENFPNDKEHDVIWLITDNFGFRDDMPFGEIIRFLECPDEEYEDAITRYDEKMQKVKEYMSKYRFEGKGITHETLAEIESMFSELNESIAHLRKIKADIS